MGDGSMVLFAKKLTNEQIQERKEWAEKELGFGDRDYTLYDNIEKMQKFRRLSTRRYRRGNDTFA